MNRIVPDNELESQTRAFTERLASGPTLAYAAGKRIARGYLDGGICAADDVVACGRRWLEHGPRAFRDKVVFGAR